MDHQFAILNLADGTVRYRDGDQSPAELSPAGLTFGEAPIEESQQVIAMIREMIAMADVPTVVVTLGKEQPRGSIDVIQGAAAQLRASGDTFRLVILREPAEGEIPTGAASLERALTPTNCYQLHDGVLVINVGDRPWAFVRSDGGLTALDNRPLYDPKPDSSDWKDQWQAQFSKLNCSGTLRAIVIIAERAWDEAQTGELMTFLRLRYLMNCENPGELPVLVVQRL